MIETSEMIWRKPTEISDLSSNGGRMVMDEIPTTHKNVFPSVGDEERVSGSTKYRKVFWHINDSENLSFVDGQAFFHFPTETDDTIVGFLGTHTDTQGDIIGSEQLYGTGQLNTALVGGETVVQVDVEDASVNIYAADMLIRLSNSTYQGEAGKNTEFIEILSVGVPSGNTIPLTLKTAVANVYSIVDTYIQSIMNIGIIETVLSAFTVTSVAGTFDDINNPPQLFNEGTVYRDITVTFTSGSVFNVTDDVTGALGSGNITTDFTYINPDVGKNMVIIPFAGWGGTYLSGDTVTFTIAPASFAIWFRRTIPAGATLGTNTFKCGLRGESDIA